jgi:hypothetical protein
MLEEFKSGTVRDFSQRYVGTYGYFTTEKDKRRILVHLSSIDHGDLSFTDDRGNSYTAKPDVGNIFEFLPLTRKLILYKGTIVHISRKPARQWQRGVSENNTSLEYIGSGRKLSLSFALLKAAYLNEYEYTRRAEEDFLSKEVGCLLLSDTFALVGDTVFLYNVKIGTLSGTVIELTTALFYQELTDLLKSLGSQFTVALKGE